MLALACGAVACRPAASSKPVSHETSGQALCAIAKDLERSKSDYPQLRGFSARGHCDAQRLVISYEHDCDPPQGGGGWSGATPAPRPGGIWLHLDFHDPSSTAQIHTQPIVLPRYYGDLDVMLLLREGEATSSIGAELEAIMARHGVTTARETP